MSWDTLADNQMVSFVNMQESGFALKSGQTGIDSLQCITKEEALTMYVMDSTPMASYASNQLIPRQAITGSCCGYLFFNSSNYTDEDLTYTYEDCETGALQNITVYYGSGGESVYGRIACDISSFEFTQLRSTGPECCGDTTLAETLYTISKAITIGTRLWESSALEYLFAHGTVWMKELSTGRVWQVDNSGLVVAEYTLCSPYEYSALFSKVSNPTTTTPVLGGNQLHTFSTNYLCPVGLVYSNISGVTWGQTSGWYAGSPSIGGIYGTGAVRDLKFLNATTPLVNLTVEVLSDYIAIHSQDEPDYPYTYATADLYYMIIPTSTTPYTIDPASLHLFPNSPHLQVFAGEYNTTRSLTNTSYSVTIPNIYAGESLYVFWRIQGTAGDALSSRARFTYKSFDIRLSFQ